MTYFPHCTFHTHNSLIFAPRNLCLLITLTYFFLCLFVFFHTNFQRMNDVLIQCGISRISITPSYKWLINFSYIWFLRPINYLLFSSVNGSSEEIWKKDYASTYFRSRDIKCLFKNEVGVNEVSEPTRSAKEWT